MSSPLKDAHICNESLRIKDRSILGVCVTGKELLFARILCTLKVSKFYLLERVVGRCRAARVSYACVKFSVDEESGTRQRIAIIAI